MIRWLFAIVFLLFLSGCSSYAWKSVQVDALQNGGGEIPCEIEYGRPYIFVSINGHPPEKFLFDTGAPIHTISGEAARRLGIAPSMRIDTKDVFGHLALQSIGFADRVELGPVILRGAAFVIEEESDRFINDRIGTIGINGLQGFTIDMDFVGNTISITNERLDPNSPHVSRYISREFAKVYVPLKVRTDQSTTRTSTLWALLDTGNNGGLMLDGSWSEKLGAQNTSARKSFATGSHNIQVDISVIPINNAVQLGTTAIEGLDAVIDQLGNNIGVMIYHDYRIKIDGPSKLVSFERADGAERVVWVERLGMYHLWKYGEDFRPGFVIPGGSAEQAGITYRDTIELIDGKPPIDSLHRAEFWPIPIDSNHVELRIRLRDSGEICDVLLPVR